MRINEIFEVQEVTAISETLHCRFGLTWSGTRNKGTSMKQGEL